MEYVYLDNAATSWPKPPEVWQAMEYFIKHVGASPGRAGHKRALEANKIVDTTRQLIAEMFNIDDYKQISFTLNATEALNTAIKGILSPGDHVITSSMEHNSVTRPLYALEQQGIEVTKIQCDEKGFISLNKVEEAIKANTKLLVITHASNVTGTIMPIKELGEIAKKHNIYFLLDAAQSAGIEKIDVKEMKIDMLACAGHKGLYGPQGTGVLYIAEGLPVKTLKEGGTGCKSHIPGQPEVLPAKFESGTLNAVGIAGLEAGLKFIKCIGRDTIRQKELELCERFIKGAKKIPGIKLYGPQDVNKQVPVVSFEFTGSNASEIRKVLDEKYNIACRAGLHCAPDAHRTLGTFKNKLVRFSFSFFNEQEEVDYALKCLKEISETIFTN